VFANASCFAVALLRQLSTPFVSLATLQALEVGFTVADFVILVEDDVLLAPDALDW